MKTESCRKTRAKAKQIDGHFRRSDARSLSSSFPPRRPCAAGLTDSRASRAARATHGDAHPARQSAHWQYCTSQHGVEQCIQDIVLGASQHASAQSERACCATSPPIRRSHHCTAVHEHPQLRCTPLKLRASPCCHSFVQCSVRAAQCQADSCHARAAVGRRPAERVRATSAAMSPAAARASGAKRQRRA